MQIIDNGIVRKIVPDKFHKIFSQKTNDYHDVVYLGKNESLSYYLEVVDPNLSQEEIDMLNEIINETDKNTPRKVDEPTMNIQELIDIFNNLINE